MREIVWKYPWPGTGRLLAAMDRFGLLSGASKHRVTRQSITAYASIIERTAEEVAVLLKNDDASNRYSRSVTD